MSVTRAVVATTGYYKIDNSGVSKIHDNDVGRLTDFGDVALLDEGHVLIVHTLSGPAVFIESSAGHHVSVPLVTRATRIFAGLDDSGMIAQMESYLGELAASEQRMARENARLLSELKLKADGMDLLISERNALAAELEEAKGWRSRLVAAQEGNRVLHEENESLRDIATRLRQDMEKSQLDCHIRLTAVQEDNHTLQTDNERLRKDIERVQQDREKEQLERARMDEAARKAASEVERLRLERDALRSEVYGLKESTHNLQREWGRDRQAVATLLEASMAFCRDVSAPYDGTLSNWTRATETVNARFKELFGAMGISAGMSFREAFTYAMAWIERARDREAPPKPSKQALVKALRSIEDYRQNAPVRELRRVKVAPLHSVLKSANDLLPALVTSRDDLFSYLEYFLTSMESEKALAEALEALILFAVNPEKET